MLLSDTPAGLEKKSDVVIPASFTGTPDKKATVVFTNPFPTVSYSVTLDPVSTGKSYIPTIESKTASGFVINLNSNILSGLAEVGWQAEEVGEE